MKVKVYWSKIQLQYIEKTIFWMLKSKIQHKEVTKMNCHKMRVYIFIIQRKRIYQDNNYREVKVLNQYTMIKN